MNKCYINKNDVDNVDAKTRKYKRGRESVHYTGKKKYKYVHYIRYIIRKCLRLNLHINGSRTLMWAYNTVHGYNTNSINCYRYINHKYTSSIKDTVIIKMLSLI